MKTFQEFLTERRFKGTKLEDNIELMKAVMSADIEKTEDELERVPNSNLEMRDAEGRTLLYLSSINPHVMKLLLKHGAEIEDSDNKYKQTPLAHCAYYNRDACVKVLLEYGANPDAKYWDASNSDSGCSPLHFYASRGDTDMVKLLLQKGANINALSDVGETPLMSCFVGKNLEKKMAKFLIDRGADINITAKNGATAYILARVKSKDEKFLELLSN